MELLEKVLFSQQLQTADQSSKPDFEADFYLGSKLGKFWDFSPRISHTKTAILQFTLKFIYSLKATKFYEIFTLLLTGTKYIGQK